jgi:nitroreductase
LDIKKSIVGRRSIRNFSNKKIPHSVLLNIIDVARWAPSHCNTQQVRFIIVDNRKKIKQIVDNGGSTVIKNSPQGILIVSGKIGDNIEYKDHIQTGAATIQNLCLYSYSLGLGTCWICHLPRKNVIRKIFGIPNFYDPIAYISIGYGINKAVIVKRKYCLDELISYNYFKNYDKYKKKIMKIILRKIYYFFPKYIKKIVNPYIDMKFVKKFKN